MIVGLETTKHRVDGEQIHRKSIAYLRANVEMAEMATTKAQEMAKAKV